LLSFRIEKAMPFPFISKSIQFVSQMNMKSFAKRKK
jgi:hypothetical protein